MSFFHSFGYSGLDLCDEVIVLIQGQQRGRGLRGFGGHKDSLCGDGEDGASGGGVGREVGGLGEHAGFGVDGEGGDDDAVHGEEAGVDERGDGRGGGAGLHPGDAEGDRHLRGLIVGLLNDRAGGGNPISFPERR